MLDWQLLIVVAVVAASVAFMLRRFALWLRGENSSGCSHCSQQKDYQQSVRVKPLAQISLPKDRDK